MKQISEEEYIEYQKLKEEKYCEPKKLDVVKAFYEGNEDEFVIGILYDIIPDQIHKYKIKGMGCFEKAVKLTKEEVNYILFKD